MGEETQACLTLSDVERALTGDAQALDLLARRLSPVIQNRVARVLVRHFSSRPNLRSTVEDFTQEIFFHLFDRSGRVLWDWNPEQGLSLESFVALVAERRVISMVRRKRRNPWTEEATADPHAEGPVGDTAGPVRPDEQVIVRDRLGRTLRRFKMELSPLGWHVFDLLFVREYSVSEVGKVTQLSPDAIYAWRSRLRRLARRFRDEEAP